MGLVESGKLPKPLTKLLNVSRKYSVWVYQWGLACCAIEMGAAFASPRQCYSAGETIGHSSAGTFERLEWNLDENRPMTYILRMIYIYLMIKLFLRIFNFNFHP